MGDYVQLGEVRTYYEDDGAGEPLVLLHPGGADSRAWGSNVGGLADRYQVFRPDRRAHGRTPDPGPMSYDLMAQDMISFLETVVEGPAYLVGHSDGAPVALLTALRRPDLVPRLVFASGVFNHAGWTPGSIDLDEETTEFFTEYHAEVSPDGPDHFLVLKDKLHAMQSAEPTLTPEDLAGYPHPALVMIGDGDGEVYVEHTLALFGGLPKGQLAVVPNTGHGMPADKPELFNRLVIDFLTEPSG
jgi:pimeloyl-ACP methyl ester carboxylesterase